VPGVVVRQSSFPFLGTFPLGDPKTKLGRTVRPYLEGVNIGFLLEGCEGFLEVVLQVSEVFDTDGNSYQSIG
jgi:hypothetical protein